MYMYMYICNQGRIQDFKLGGGAHLKKLHRAEGGKKKICHVIFDVNIDVMDVRGRTQEFVAL